jgi:hypothetical protein
MANIFAIYSIGNSLATYLSRSYPQALRNVHACDFMLLSAGEINKLTDPATTVSLFLYRVTMNEHLRNAPQANGNGRKPVPLIVDLHYLLTAWARTALAEQVVLSWAMRQLHQTPVLDTALLSPDAGWAPGDSVQLIPTDLSNEELMRIWDRLEPSYRLSIAYTARIVRIDPDSVIDAVPVVATRYTLTEREAVP